MNTSSLLLLVSAMFLVILIGCSNVTGPSNSSIYEANSEVEFLNHKICKIWNSGGVDWYTITAGDSEEIHVYAISGGYTMALDSLTVVPSDTNLHIAMLGKNLFLVYTHPNYTIVKQCGWQRISISMQGFGEDRMVPGNKFIVKKNIMLHIQKKMFSPGIYYIDFYDSTGQVCSSDTGVLSQFGLKIFYEPRSIDNRYWTCELLYNLFWDNSDGFLDPPYGYDWVIYMDLISSTSYWCMFTGFYEDTPFNILEGTYGIPPFLKKVVLRSL